MDPIAQILFRHFPMVSELLDVDHWDNPSEIAAAIARWFSDQPGAPDRQMRSRMERFYSDPEVSIQFGSPPIDAATVMQVAFFEYLWHLPNAEFTIPQVASIEYLRESEDSLSAWLGRDTYLAVMSRIASPNKAPEPTAGSLSGRGTL